MRLFVLGSANIDLTFRVPRMPVPGVTEVCPYQLGFGGKGANQAVQAARLGAQVTFCGKVGDDAFGPAIIEQLTREGVATEHVSVAPGMLTGTAVILVEPSGTNSIVTHGGPNIALSIEDIERSRPSIERAEIFLATLETPAGPLSRALSIARAAGIRTILNPAPPVNFPHELLELVDICLPNQSELNALVDDENVEVAADLLRRRGPHTVIVTMGDQGSVIIDDDGLEVIRATPVAAIDTSGAGDSFAAALAVSLGEGNDMRTAARFANRVAAISVTRAGTQSSFPKRDQLSTSSSKPS